jgi:hypothetical protein
MKKQSTNINKVLMWRWGSSSQRCWPLEIRLLKPCWHQPESAENDETKPVKPVVCKVDVPNLWILTRMQNA